MSSAHSHNSRRSQVIGSYELLEVIGEGGMADVYLGIKKSVSNIRNFYAVKVIKSTHAADERFARMFLDEARVMSSIRHPNLVTLHDMVAWEGQYLIVMEYLKGLDGRRLMGGKTTRKPLPAEIAVNIAYQACGGLHYAHQARSIEGEDLQLVHRDISPHNLFITFDGFVKVLDFGIAKSEIQAEETKSGFLKGKVPYLSPEQCSSEGPIDRRTDVYALGVVLYEFLTGRRPFAGKNEIQVLQSILYQEPKALTVFNRAVPKKLSELVLKALAKNPDERFFDCEEFREALSELGRGQGWSLSERALRNYMQGEHGEYQGALEEKLLELLTFSGGSAESGMALAFEDRSVQRLTLGPDCLGAVRQRGNLVGYKLSGQLRESFDYSHLLEESAQVLVLDLAGINRMTSFGIRQWLVLMPQLKERNQRVVFHRVSVTVANQMVTIPAMIEGMEVLSMMVPFHCTTCAHQFDHVVRGDEFIPLTIKCVRWSSNTANFDEDDTYLSLIEDGKPLDEGVKSFLEELEGLDERTSVQAVEKRITAERTEINLQGDVPSSTRWDRLLAGVEGELWVQFAPATMIDQGTWERFLSVLDQSQEEVELAIWGFPLEGVGGLEALRQSSEVYRSVLFASACPECARVEHREWKLNEEEATAICRQCSEPLSRKMAPPVKTAKKDVVHLRASTSSTEIESISRSSSLGEAPEQKQDHTSGWKEMFTKSWGFTAIVAALILAIIIALLM